MNVYPWYNYRDTRTNIDGSYLTHPAALVGNLAGGNLWGYLDGVKWISGFANASENLFAEVDPVFYSGTGTGRMRGVSAENSAETETWTVTATSTSEFTVSGSVSGGQANADVNVPYDNGSISFEIVAGQTPYQLGDQYIITAARFIVIPDIYRSNRWDYAAIRLE